MFLYLFSFLIAAALLGVDQYAKFWVENHMALEEIRTFLPPFLELHAVHNYGAAWSIFSGARWVLVGVTTVMMLAVAAALLLRVVRHPVGVFASFLILAGGMGNLLDRIVQGYVVDMLRFPFWTSYPTFNVADICVVSGCMLWLVYALAVQDRPDTGRRESRRRKSAGEADTGTGREHHDPYIEGANDDWQEKWRQRQRERRGEK